MFTKGDKSWLQKNFATKDDLKSFATKNDLKGFATKDDLKSIKEDVHTLKKDFSNIKSTTEDSLRSLEADVKAIRKDVAEIKDTTEFTKAGVVNLLDWTQDIHETIVKEELPKRVKKLEHALKVS